MRVRTYRRPFTFNNDKKVAPAFLMAGEFCATVVGNVHSNAVVDSPPVYVLYSRPESNDCGARSCKLD